MLKFNEVYFLTKYLNILYVEDDEDIRESVGEILEDFFNTVILAVDGEDGIKKYKEFKDKNNEYPDLIMTDLNMPKKDGITMIKEITDLNKKQKVIVISAHNDSDKLINLIELGVSSFILKPIENQKLLNAIYKTSKEVYDEKSKENYLIKQSKMAQMGEMIDVIAHQWMQPIQIMKMQNDYMVMMKELDKVSVKNVDNYIKIQISQTEHLFETLNEFRNFFKDDKKKTETTYKELVEKVLLLLDGKVKNRVKIINNLKGVRSISVFVNEFKHVLMNIIINAIEAFDSKGIKDRFIKFDCERENGFLKLHITDNAGGIKKSVLNKIFNPYFTTKENGSGIGLYLSKLIISKVGGDLKVENFKDGARFIISLPEVN